MSLGLTLRNSPTPSLDDDTAVVLPRSESKDVRVRKRLSFYFPSKESKVALEALNGYTESSPHTSPRPWNSPRTGYSTARALFEGQDLHHLIKRKKSQWEFINQSISEEGARELKLHLTSKFCHVKLLKFTNCSMEKEFITALAAGLKENQTVQTLILEGCVFDAETAGLFRKSFESGCYSLRKLEFLNVSIKKEALEDLVAGIVSQNNLVFRMTEDEMSGLDTPFTLQNFKQILDQLTEKLGLSNEGALFSVNELMESFQKALDLNLSMKEQVIDLLERKVGLRFLTFEGCRLSHIHGEQLGKLLARSTKITSLNLIGNLLGSGILNSVKPDGDAVHAIAKGLAQNVHLNDLSLASNGLSEADWSILEEVVVGRGDKAPKNTSCSINVTNNGLEKLPRHKRLINYGSSPRERERSFSTSTTMPMSQRIFQASRSHSKITRTQSEEITHSPRDEDHLFQAKSGSSLL